ncbi:plastocyanin/azurin family copper-binding protein, partial [Acidobacteria bacterium AH-259-D05]|nr:plastocyanin/azurin family copper-binding protein [Acidobacteria bacterium AH-259-D05]
MSSKMDRRDFFILAGSTIVSVGAFPQEALPPEAPQTGDVDIPRIMSLFSFNKGTYYFDPAGLYVEVGQTVEWVGVAFRGARAFHPSIDNHELRIPENAKPFDTESMAPGSGTFRWTFEVEGTYDYYSRLHEYLGMVGRIVVGKPGGPGQRPPGYGNREGRTVMYRDAARLFEYLNSDEIVQKKVI